MKRARWFEVLLIGGGLLVFGAIFAGANDIQSAVGNLPADQAVQKLTDNEWQWQDTATTGGEIVTPKQEDAFVLSFPEANRFASTTDCNSLSGSYTASGENLSFGQIAMTLMYCENSQESFYSAMLADVEKFYIAGDVLTFNTKSGETSVFVLHQPHN